MKVQTAFRIDKRLLEVLKLKAQAQKRSLNNYIEYVLYKDVGNVPNDLTQKAIEEADNDINMTTIEDLKIYKQSIIDGQV